ncbi:sigma factor [Gudongella oleilytica]|jgi:RNA polymerase sigma factor|uniref:sigma factor n=1 Tax=Gudongella oleilytica TaxID=1582259 RepID=UPI000FF8A699|nr:sigma factor [Gudongella oleilytica]
MREIDNMVVQVKDDETALEDFVKSQEGFIIKAASRTSKHYITRSDDEWSIALSAFVEAVEKYDLEKGSFMAFAELLIRRRLIDWFRINSRNNEVIHVEDIENEPDTSRESDEIKLEIRALEEDLRLYGISFMDLADASPKAQKTRDACRKAINWIIENPLIINQMKESNQLPIKIIENNSGVPRKILERHRKYIIAVVEILAGDYPWLNEYVRQEGR